MRPLPALPNEQRTSFARPRVAVDTVLFAMLDRRLMMYLVQLRRGPLRARWAFPGGLVRTGETLDDAARRELKASTSMSRVYLEQLCTFGDPSRDPHAHVVAVAYLALLCDPEEVRAPSDKYSTGRWFDVSTRPALAYDHAQMASYALRRLKAKLGYTNIACNLLPRSFTFADLEKLYAAVLGRRIDRRNFRRRIMAMGLLRAHGKARRGAHRPAALYRFTQRTPQVIELL